MFYPFYVNPVNLKISLEKKGKYTVKVNPIRPEGEESRWTWGIDTSKERINELVAKEFTRKGKTVFDIYRIDRLEDETGNIKREKLKSVWDFKELNYQHARGYFKEFFGTSELFDFPKPPELIKKLCESLNEKEFCILDFFAGSGTTAQAIIELNKEDGGSRKYILIQLPEKIDEDTIAFQEGYTAISDICKERIRRVIKKIDDEKKNKPELFEDKELDLGFKVFKLKHSNFKLWRGDVIENGEELEKQIEVFEQPVKEGASEQNILYELILKSGYELTSRIEYITPHNIKGGTGVLFSIANGELIIALFSINDVMIKEIIKLKPKKCIILDKLFNSNDQLKTNTVLQMKDAGIEFKTI
jgi:hypothetical protein